MNELVEVRLRIRDRPWLGFDSLLHYVEVACFGELFDNATFHLLKIGKILIVGSDECKRQIPLQEANIGPHVAFGAYLGQTDWSPAFSRA
eukprot:CAMPEP_0185259102 /NCGR_PEP_ID=MMETSP1359-20130426/7937_1 /TAXON_ID=552665 /ORGANISM="Bigelowiella longifila, Strain CCMP242" /LENGTH=89 /DNA_ID=CAMNT_0027844885 /DNA_START=415 /DNA_END=684 /DNA_ORIENTATION=-